MSRNPDIIKAYRAASYSNPEPGINQIRVDSPDTPGGAVAASWSLETLSLSNARTVKLTFDLLTTIPVQGPYGPRITASVGFATSYSNNIAPDRSPLFPNGTLATIAQIDSGLAGDRLIFDSSLWLNPDAPISGNRISKICQDVTPGYANDNTWHSYVVEMNLTSQTTKSMVDGEMAKSTCPSFSFVPTHVIFWTQGHDTGTSAVAQLRNPRVTIYRAESSGVAPPPLADSPFLQWWFWAIAGLATTSVALLFTNIRSRSQLRATGQAVGQNKGSVCPQCGGQMPENSAFCGKCGHKLGGQS